MFRYLGLWPLMLLLTSCVSWTSVTDTGEQSQHFLGYTKVAYPKVLSSNGRTFEVKNTSNIGISYGDAGASLGYFEYEKISLPPENSFYIEVETKEQFQILMEFLQQQQDYQLWIRKAGHE